jgi:hypothetical protein
MNKNNKATEVTIFLQRVHSAVERNHSTGLDNVT